ncbi:MAG TPA: hypothetical protein VNJ03_18230, partial [Vicinamibacterales bacterium]|nr:hypothetical protein [Vicinamibacterales bacterium]
MRRTAYQAAEKCQPEWKMVDGKWERTAKYWRFTIFHLPFAMQDAFFSILLQFDGRWLTATRAMDRVGQLGTGADDRLDELAIG